MGLHKKWQNRISFIMLMFFMLVLCVPISAQAIEPLEVGEDVSLKIIHQEEQGPIAGAVFHIYKVAEVSRYAEFTKVGKFADFEITLNDLDSSGWKNAAEACATFVEKEEIEPSDSGITDLKGELYFPAYAMDMKTGLYLIVGEPITIGYKTYHSEPVFVCLPNRDIDDTWVYDVEIATKYSIDIEKKDVIVKLIWKDRGDKNRPKEVEIELWKDGEVFDKVVLNQDSNWEHIWEDLDPEYEWKVVQPEVPEGYESITEQEEGTFVIQNSKDYVMEETPDSSELTQTGMLWWPVPVLAVFGMIFFIIGWIKYQRSEV